MNALTGREAKSNWAFCVVIFRVRAQDRVGQDGGDFAGALFGIQLIWSSSYCR